MSVRVVITSLIRIIRVSRILLICRIRRISRSTVTRIISTGLRRWINSRLSWHRHTILCWIWWISKICSGWWTRARNWWIPGMSSTRISIVVIIIGARIRWISKIGTRWNRIVSSGLFYRRCIRVRVRIRVRWSVIMVVILVVGCTMTIYRRDSRRIVSWKTSLSDPCSQRNWRLLFFSFMFLTLGF